MSEKPQARYTLSEVRERLEALNRYLVEAESRVVDAEERYYALRDAVQEEVERLQEEVERLRGEARSWRRAGGLKNSHTAQKLERQADRLANLLNESGGER